MKAVPNPVNNIIRGEMSKGEWGKHPKHPPPAGYGTGCNITS